MALEIPNGCGVTTWTFRYGPLGRDCSVTCGFRNLVGENNPNVIATAFKGYMTAVGRPAEPSEMSSAWSLLQVNVLMRLAGGSLVSGDDLIAVAGTSTPAANLQPIFTSWVVTKKTDLAGKAYRGRYYYPGFRLSESNVDVGGTIDPAAVTAHQARQSAFRTACDGGQLPLTLLHDETSPAALTAQPITQLTVRPVLGVQRRRRNPGA